MGRIRRPGSAFASVFAFAVFSLAASACLAQEALEATDVANHPFSVDFAPGGKLRLRVRSAEVHIVGMDSDRISVELSGRNATSDRARSLKVRFKREGAGGSLRVSGGPKSDLTITVRIPSRTNLYARIPFGEVHVERVAGDTDVEVHAGDLTVRVGDSADYARVDASVYTGEIDASAFGEEHGGLFRSFKWNGNGRYRLHAHVGAGQLTIE